jgi:hypothetical protein
MSWSLFKNSKKDLSHYKETIRLGNEFGKQVKKLDYLNTVAFRRKENAGRNIINLENDIDNLIKLSWELNNDDLIPEIDWTYNDTWLLKHKILLDEAEEAFDVFHNAYKMCSKTGDCDLDKKLDDFYNANKELLVEYYKGFLKALSVLIEEFPTLVKFKQKLESNHLDEIYSDDDLIAAYEIFSARLKDLGSAFRNSKEVVLTFKYKN